MTAEFSLKFLGSFLKSQIQENSTEASFIVDAHPEGVESLLASSCQMSGARNTCGLSPRSSETDPHWPAGAGPSREYLGTEPIGEGTWQPMSFWRTADIQGGLARPLQSKVWSLFASSDTINTTGCSWCTSDTGRSWVKMYTSSEGATVSSDLMFDGTKYVLVLKGQTLSSPAVNGMRVPSRELRWVFVSLISQSERLQEQMDAALESRARTQATVDNMWAELEEEEIVVGVIITSVTFAIAVVGIGVIMAATDPIRMLSRQMRAAAELRLAHMDLHHRSRLTEIASLQNSFQVLIRALHEYQAYLPEFKAQTSMAETLPPVGNGTICFTDIVGSTALWQLSPDDMNIALVEHNSVIRNLVQLHEGYEVKTIGDCFMVAFQDRMSAILFAGGVQGDLVEARWPDSPELGVHPLWSAQRDKEGRLTWRGIAVRVGLEAGELVEERNPLTDRFDYRGTVVNMAARLESTAPNGTIQVTEAFVEALSEDGGLPSEFVSRSPSCVHLKGFGDTSTVVLVPSGLRARLTQPPRPIMDVPLNPLGQRESLALRRSESRGTETSSNFSGDGHGPRTRVADLRGAMQVGRGAVAVWTCRDPADDGFSRWLERVVTAAARTQGKVDSVAASLAFASWNLTLACSSWQESPLLFVKLSDTHGSHAGACCGRVPFGHVGSSWQRFSTTTGVIARAALEICKAAFDFRVAGLISWENDEVPQTQASFLRPVDIWDLSGNHPSAFHTGDIVTLFQPHLDSIVKRRHLEESAFFLDDPSWSQSYCSLFREAVLNGSPAALERICEIAKEADDRVLAAVYSRLALFQERHCAGAQCVAAAPFSAVTVRETGATDELLPPRPGRLSVVSFL
eukprot:TRINITY_DN25590_c0_g1_i1.p1 TRINITY_DN25590_c0_g1~~TRINITY_DN25590_c0_g1_i1.p1  ORF type:complete len:919 (+),score=106.81 TRINITY_DN25590_c0_g1_i1:195-2759(+)